MRITAAKYAGIKHIHVHNGEAFNLPAAMRAMNRPLGRRVFLVEPLRFYRYPRREYLDWLNEAYRIASVVARAADDHWGGVRVTF